MLGMPESIIIADDHPLFRDAVKQSLLGDKQNINCLDASDLQSLDELLEKDDNVDLVLMDLHMPGVQGFTGLLFINKKYPDVPVAMISANEDPQTMQRAIEHGAVGFIPKSASIEQILEAVKSIHQGNVWLPERSSNINVPGISHSETEAVHRLNQLTPQQLRVLSMLAQGLSNKSIADDLNLAEATIKVHVTAIMRKLGVNNRTQAVLLAKHLDVKPSHINLGEKNEASDWSI